MSTLSTETQSTRTDSTLSEPMTTSTLSGSTSTSTVSLKYRNTDHVDRINTEWTKFYDQYNQCYFNYLNIFDHEHLERINFHFNNICEIFNRHIHQLEYRNTDYIDRINTKWTDFYEQYN
ncbi:hypothetical protein BFW01_g6547 [Lasiodiplodia theobromae]|nr:hypothetical protein BFW01_g6547 [Lasiodiplodia theobromae]